MIISNFQNKHESCIITNRLDWLGRWSCIRISTKLDKLHWRQRTQRSQKFHFSYKYWYVQYQNLFCPNNLSSICWIHILFKYFYLCSFEFWKCHIDFHKVINCILKQSKSIQQYSISGIFAKRITVFMYVLQIFQIANIVELMYCIHNTLSCTSIN